MEKLKQQKYEVRPISQGGRRRSVGVDEGQGLVGASPHSPPSISLFPAQINVLYNRISHAQKL